MYFLRTVLSDRKSGVHHLLKLNLLKVSLVELLVVLHSFPSLMHQALDSETEQTSR